MFVRAKKSGAYQYLQLVRSERVDGHVRQQVIATLGRLDVLQDAGRIDALKRFEIDEEKVCREARFDGLWVLQSDAELTAADTALKYKALWMVESMFRALKSVLETRPVYHQCDETICGHVFCSFLALVLLKELRERMKSRPGGRGELVEWEYLKRDLDALEQTTVNNAGRTFVIRSRLRGNAAKALQAAGVSLGPTVRFCE